MKSRTPLSRVALTLFFGSFVVGATACEVGSGRSSSPRYPNQGPAGAMRGPEPVGGQGPAETHGPNAARQMGSAPLYLPGSPVRQLVNYEIVNGQAVMEGDIILGPPATLAFTYGMPRVNSGYMKGAVTLKDKSHLWPNGEIPYIIDSSVSPKKVEYINWAISQVNETALTVRPRTPADKDYVKFRDTGRDCSSYLGRIGGGQGIQVGGCGKGSVIHEILHAAGFYHEQSRGDRDEHITIMWDNIVPQFKSAFRKRDGRGQDIGIYDYSSVMHYSGRAFSRNGKPTIVPKVPNAPIGQRAGLSSLDKAAIAQLYGGGGAPTVTPPTTTPPTTKPPTTNKPPAPGASYAGNYTSQRGNVSCTQSGSTVSCRFPGGSMLCAARGHQLECGWSGGGQGRALFQRQSNGVVAGSYGDFFSANSRGKWDLVPAGGAPPPTNKPPPPTSKPPTSKPPTTTPPATTTSLAGSYTSTRGPMNCTDSGNAVTCSFRTGSGAAGRLDCAKDRSGLQLSCGWITYPPMPGSGRAAFTRQSTSSRNLSGTWGHFFAHTGGGKWDASAK